MDFVEAMENTGLSKQMAQRILNRFATLQEAWSQCIDNSFKSGLAAITLQVLFCTPYASWGGCPMCYYLYA